MWKKWMQESALSVSLSFSLTSEVVLSRALASIVAFFSFAATNFAKTADLWLLHLISGVKVERGGDGSRRWLNKHLRHPRSFHLQNEKNTLLDVSCVQCVSAYVCVWFYFLGFYWGAIHCPPFTNEGGHSSILVTFPLLHTHPSKSQKKNGDGVSITRGENENVSNLWPQNKTRF